jgi:hypothetical protein
MPKFYPDPDSPEDLFDQVSEAAAESGAFVLNECTLMESESKDENKDKDGDLKDGEKKPKRAPIGVRHKDDGVQTPDRFSWAHGLDKWFAVWIWQGVPAVQIMTQSRLNMALGFIGKYNYLLPP